ncbi:MAG TPA: Rrf2 family transcriptional regulator [Chromatiaceae bacterium]|jgi:Rrf2 family iron-sulfur cluster assembly transcriptional regulator|nr:Rrf2 family transcriptional regulator [Chromatiaceae bacterium]HIN82060.1 Rrf2 family transcriptional regulator [Chromatiales bacterium]HIA09258.1 Rrf2 family transcriptional regulator [Chromatiaceae bacterium]HIB83513.1 Rrf2 family transcriptional regulator [Chromatiaceae bacterium]HIO14212.1 Rrf2 family transcriptional regulator [Chromatiales bacterium]
MKLSTKGRYAVTAMLDLAMHEGKSPVSLADISRCQKISLSYLEQLFAKLRKNGLVRGVRGPGGGYRLGQEPAEISVFDIVSAVEEQLDFMRCAGRSDCDGGQECLTHALWCDLSSQIQGYLQSITLSDLVSDQNIQSVSMRQDLANDRAVVIPEITSVSI